MAVDGLTTISLGNGEFEGENAAYVLDGDGLALVDTGMPTATIRQQLESELGSHGYSFADVEDVVLTHWHPDHAGLAAAIQEAGGATVYIHGTDAPLLRGSEDAFDRMETRQRERFEAWNIPDEKRAAIPMNGDDTAESVMPAPDSVTTIADGDVLSVGGFDLEAIHTPGHTAGSCCFEFETWDRRAAFAGDTVLPTYTPNIGGSDARVERPLATYLDSLARVRERDYAALLPGHRGRIDDPDERIGEISTHHRERSERIVAFLRENGPADAWTVSAHLFGDLDGIHIVHGPGEAAAHLDYLDERGVLASTGTEYEVRNAPDAALWDRPA